MKPIAIALACILMFTSQVALSLEGQLTPEQQEYQAWAKSLWDSLNRQQGVIKLPNDVASLNVPDGFYYLNPVDSEKVLVEVWDNPPGAGSESFGMLFPADSTPFDEGTWAVTIEYEEDGYVSDEDADEIDYQELLTQMKESVDESSAERVKQGYESIGLVGWASTPFYDKKTHKLHWAKELKFGAQTANTLNYNIRVLGRKGVLVLNFIAGMDQKALIDSKVDKVVALADFDQGSRYEDFNPDMDKVAAYGIGALVAGKVMAKAGILAAALIFLKKFGILFIIGVGVVARKLFKRKKAEVPG